MTDKSIESDRIGVGSAIILPSDHSATKFVYLYDSHNKALFVATVTYTVFFHDPPIVDIAERNILKLRNDFSAARRVPSKRELSFLLKRRLRWYRLGPYPASFDYFTEKQLDREMMILYSNMEETDQYDNSQRNTPRNLNPHQRPAMTDNIRGLERTSSYKSTLKRKSKGFQGRSESISKLRPTHMSVGFIGTKWPESAHLQREKELYKLYLAEQKRLAMATTRARQRLHRQQSHLVDHSASTTKATVEGERDMRSLKRIINQQYDEIEKLRQSLRQSNGIYSSGSGGTQQRKRETRKKKHRHNWNDSYSRETESSKAKDKESVRIPPTLSDSRVNRAVQSIQDRYTMAQSLSLNRIKEHQSNPSNAVSMNQLKSDKERKAHSRRLWMGRSRFSGNDGRQDAIIQKQLIDKPKTSRRPSKTIKTKDLSVSNARNNHRLADRDGVDNHLMGRGQDDSNRRPWKEIPSYVSRVSDARSSDSSLDTTFLVGRINEVFSMNQSYVSKDIESDSIAPNVKSVDIQSTVASGSSGSGRLDNADTVGIDISDEDSDIDIDDSLESDDSNGKYESDKRSPNRRDLGVSLPKDAHRGIQSSLSQQVMHS